MGQRLNIEILENGEILANAYYHWYGYTTKALEITQLVLNASDVEYSRNIVKAIKMLEATGARYSFQYCSVPDNGLIAISEEGIEEARRWEDARVEVDIEMKIVNFHIDTITNEEAEEDEVDVDYERLPVIDINFNKVSFEDFPKFRDQVTELMSNGVFEFRLKNDDKIYFFIT